MTDKELNKILFTMNELCSLPSAISKLQEDMKILADEVINLRREIINHRNETLRLTEEKKPFDEVNTKLWSLINKSIDKKPDYLPCKNCIRYFYSYDAEDDLGLCYYCWFDQESKKIRDLKPCEDCHD
jgi:hypothetical protein